MTKWALNNVIWIFPSGCSDSSKISESLLYRWVLHGLHRGSNNSQSIGLTKRTAAARRGVLSQTISVVAANKWGLQTCQN